MEYKTEVVRFLDNHLGMFVHWGLFSVLAGEWNGKELDHDQLGEWAMLHFRIPLVEYKQLVNSFNPAPDFAEKWVQAAKKAGMRYIVLTTMHLDGFCLFRTKVRDYNTYDMIDRDLVGELAAACRKHDIKLGLYYSHTQDMSEKDALGTSLINGEITEDGNTWDFPNESEKNYDRFFYGKVLPQVRELLTQYGDILLMWFDYPHNIKPEQSLELYNFVKSIQPRCLVNSRIGHGFGDYYDLGDNQIPSVAMGVPQECLVTLNDTWGYKRNDHNWKTSEQIIDMVIRTATCGSNLLMNVGPMSNGDLTSETVHIMDGIADWISRNSEAVYGTQQNPLKAVFDWGYLTQKENKLYLYLKDKAARTLVINGLESDVDKVTAIGDGLEISFEQRDDPHGYRSLVIRLQASPFNMPVYCIHCKSGIRVDDRLLQQADSLSLYPLWARKYCGDGDQETAVDMRIENNLFDKNNGKYGLALDRVGIASAWKSADEFLQWDALITDSGTYEIQMLSMPGEHLNNADCGVTVSIVEPDGTQHTVSVDLLMESFNFSLNLSGINNQRIGSVLGQASFSGKGMYDIRLRRNCSGKVALPFVSLLLKRVSDTLMVTVAGDFCMRTPLDELIGTKEEPAIFADIGSVMQNADIRLVNLENPLIDGGSPIPKSGPNLKSPTAGVSMLETAGFEAAILANNHIGDFGKEGVMRTLEVLDSHGIGHVGAGINFMEARKPWIVERKGKKLAVLAACENEFGTADRDKPGSNGLDEYRLCEDIEKATHQADYVMVIIHGGNEYSPTPAPVIVDRFRSFVSAGADAVIGMHPHCPQGYEIFNGKPIVYSTGNFIFCNEPKADLYDPWFYGYLPFIKFGDNNPELSIHPYRFTPDGRRITLLSGHEKEKFLTYIEHLSDLIRDRSRLLKLYESWCVLKGREFANWLNYKEDRMADAETDQAMLDLRHAFTCESHNDLLKTYLKILCDGRLAECAQGIPSIIELQKISI